MTAPPFPQLQAFLAVAKLRSFSAAGHELGVSRSAVSQAVQQPEDRLRVVLLTRTTRSVGLTDAGRRLVESPGPAVRQTIAALTEVAAQPGETVGRIRLSVPRAAVPFVIALVLPTFRARHPRVEVEVAEPGVSSWSTSLVRGHREGAGSPPHQVNGAAVSRFQSNNHRLTGAQPRRRGGILAFFRTRASLR